MTSESNIYNYSCFLKGTKILTSVNHEETWIEIENLCKGDLVKTVMHGFVPINTIGYREIENIDNLERTESRLYVYKKDPNHSYLLDDLVLTGMHSVLVKHITPEFKQEIKKICRNHVYFTDEYWRLPVCIDYNCQPYENIGTHTIYYFTLENFSSSIPRNYGIYANKMIVETSSITSNHLVL